MDKDVGILRQTQCALYAGIIVLVIGILSCVNFMGPASRINGPIVVITFDDADPSVYKFAYPAMKAQDSSWAATHFFPVTFMEMQNYVTLDQETEMERGGWETGGHAVTHANLSSLPIDTVRQQVKESYNFLVQSGLSHESFAYPFGNYNDTVRKITGEYFDIIRSAHDYEYLDGVDKKELGYFAVKGGCSAYDVIGRVEKAKTQGAPLVVIGFHAIIPDTVANPPPVYWCKESVFMAFIKYLKKEELPVLTLKEAVKILCP
jgi:peptidoglycan/xylan/chitin deacetylase (PgdA/CDA1 family)